MKKYSIVLALTALLLASCASQSAYRYAADSLERGDYVSAALNAARSLSHDAKNYKALDLLQKSFPLAQESMEAESSNALASGQARLWERVAAAWEAMHAMNDAIQRLPALYRKGSKSPVSFKLVYNQSLLAQARAEAAENRYQEGLVLARAGDRRSYREAYENFLVSMDYQAGYKDAAKRAEEVRALGSDRIAVIPFVTAPGLSDPLNSSGLLYDAFLSQLVTGAARKTFLQVVERGRIEALLSEREFSISELMDGRLKPTAFGFYGANIIVFGQLLSISYAYPTVTSVAEFFEAIVDEPIPGALPVNGVVPTQKALKRVLVNRFTKSSSLTVTIAYRAVNAENSVIVDADTRSLSAADEHVWALYLGDKEALPPAYLSLVQAKERDIRGPQELLPALCSTLGAQLASRLVASF
ncbi:MAG TPA: hypothetical protein DCG47_07560 [Spirochaetaceae bacterium]|nr:hypothetical protein [Spirochaetaceae bacterium]